MSKRPWKSLNEVSTPEKKSAQCSSDDSRFATCPVCSRQIPKYNIDAHAAAHFEQADDNQRTANVTHIDLTDSPTKRVKTNQTDHMEPVSLGGLGGEATSRSTVGKVVFGATSTTARNALKQSTPLAERMRPRSLDDIVGHDDLLAAGSMLRSLLEKDRV